MPLQQQYRHSSTVMIHAQNTSALWRLVQVMADFEASLISAFQHLDVQDERAANMQVVTGP